MRKLLTVVVFAVVSAFAGRGDVDAEYFAVVQGGKLAKKRKLKGKI